MKYDDLCAEIELMKLVLYVRQSFDLSYRNKRSVLGSLRVHDVNRVPHWSSSREKFWHERARRKRRFYKKGKREYAVNPMGDALKGVGL